MIRPFTASSLCVTSKEPRPPERERRGINISGVDFWHAVEFSRNGRFLCTHPLGLSSGRFPSVLRFRLYQIFPIRFPRCFPGSRFRVSLSGGSDFIRSSEPVLPAVRFRFIGRALHRIQRFGEAGRCSLLPSGVNPSPGNCSNLPPRSLRVNGSGGNEEDSSSSPGVDAHQAAVGTVALRSAASTSPVSPARTARPPRT